MEEIEILDKGIAVEVAKVKKRRYFMVLDAIYDEYEHRIIMELEKSNSDDEIEKILYSGVVHDMILKRLAKALSVAIYRNGKIEDIHAGNYDGAEKYKGIPDNCMKEINIDVCNKMYTMLKLLLADDEDSFKMASIDIAFGSMCATDWNDPVIDESLYSLKLLDLLN
jgi:hypothetical protein